MPEEENDLLDSEEENTLSYGANKKTIYFEIIDYRHAELVNRLRYDGFRLSDLLRTFLQSYLDKDKEIEQFIDKYSSLSKIKKKKVASSEKKGKQSEELFKERIVSQEELEEIFDLIEEMSDI